MRLLSPLLAANLHRLVCPVCHATLTLIPEGIDCTGCERRYPVVDGLPVLIASRAILRTNPVAPETKPDFV